jgi:hypothetical protein
MANRPCKPDADLNWLWLTLLPGTPLPACGVPEESNSASNDSAKLAKNLRGNAEPMSRKKN